MHFQRYAYIFWIYAFILIIIQLFLIDFMHEFMHRCIGCAALFKLDTDGAMSEMATPHRTAGHPNDNVRLLYTVYTKNINK